LLREWLRLHGWVPGGWDMVLVAKDSAARQLHLDDFASDLTRILRQLHDSFGLLSPRVARAPAGARVPLGVVAAQTGAELPVSPDVLRVCAHSSEAARNRRRRSARYVAHFALQSAVPRRYEPSSRALGAPLPGALMQDQGKATVDRSGSRAGRAARGTKCFTKTSPRRKPRLGVRRRLPSRPPRRSVWLREARLGRRPRSAWPRARGRRLRRPRQRRRRWSRSGRGDTTTTPKWPMILTFDNVVASFSSYCGGLDILAADRQALRPRRDPRVAPAPEVAADEERRETASPFRSLPSSS